VFEEFANFVLLGFGDFDDLALLADFFVGVVLGITAGGEVSAKTHGDGAGGNFGEASDDDEASGGDGTGEAGGEGEGELFTTGGTATRKTSPWLGASVVNSIATSPSRR